LDARQGGNDPDEAAETAGSYKADVKGVTV
jgi:hypothetical protein